MCGIFGFLGVELADPRSVLISATGALIHRGPDQAGVYHSGDVGLAAVRLAVVDLANGSQPMTDGKGRWLVYNGEVYNHQSLRNRLSTQGVQFSSRCDSEVVLRSLAMADVAALTSFNGGFAAAYYDKCEHRALLFRDRFGERPLYYTETGSGIAFASEIRALCCLPGFRPHWDASRLSSIAAIWTPVHTGTSYKNVHQIPPGHYLEWKSGSWAIHQYIDIPSDPSQLTFEEAREELRYRLDQSVRLRLQADIPVGAYLSGGIDSTIVTALAAQGSPLHSFSVEFESEALDESVAQLLAAKSLGTSHHSRRISSLDIAAHFREAVTHAEIPLFRTAAVPMYLLAKNVREAGLAVVLTGEGADEALLGYDIFKEALLLDDWHGLPLEQRMERTQKLYPYISGVARDPRSLFMRFEVGTSDPKWFSVHRLRWRESTFSQRLFPGVQVTFEECLGSAFPEYRSSSRLNDAQYAEYKTLLANYLLSSQGDRMAFAFGIETRLPFLDPSVVELARSLPPHYHIGPDGTEKLLLRESFRAAIPAEIYQKRKQPFRAPDAAPLLRHQAEYWTAMLEQHASEAALPFVDWSFARKLLKKLLAQPDTVSERESRTLLLLCSLIHLEDHWTGYAGKYMDPHPRLTVCHTKQ